MLNKLYKIKIYIKYVLKEQILRKLKIWDITFKCNY